MELPKPPPGTRDPADKARDELAIARYRSHTDLVEMNARQLARRIGTGAVTLDDMRSFGQEGLLTAARTFDEERGVPFRRWANLRIRGAILDGVRRWGSLPRRIYREIRAISAADALQEAHDEEDATPRRSLSPETADAVLSSRLAGLATAMALGAASALSDDVLEAPEPGASPEDRAVTADLVSRIKVIMERLPDAERTLIDRHYFAGETLDHAAGSLGLSKSWGSRLHARAIEAIARELRRSERS